MNINTKADFTAEMDRVITKTVQQLSDSPQSRIAQCQNHIGFYQGYCQAKGWDSDLDMILKWEGMMVSGKVYADASVIPA